MDASSGRRDAIREMAYIELMIHCEEPGCVEVFETFGTNDPSDPIDEWTESFAIAAREAGWATDAKGRVLCPRRVRA